MRRLLLLLPIFVASFAGWREMHASREVRMSQAAELAPTRSERPGKLARRDAAPAKAESDGARLPSRRTPPGSASDVRERLMRASAGTYIDEILLSRDSALVRWPSRQDAPLRVWVASGTRYDSWDDGYPSRVRDAFSAWQANRIPMRFTFVVDSSDADIHVVWTDKFDAPISGKTLWSRDKRWWIVGGTITLALHHSTGEALDEQSIYAIALHEVGHLLGLDHTSDTSNIMTPRVRARELSAADRATVELLYTLPPGPVK